jgi:hypothetical protein
MVASFDVTIFLEALLGRSFAPPTTPMTQLKGLDG